MCDTTSRDRPAGQRGFTLMEALVTMSIIAIAAAIALPNFRTVMMASTAKSLSADLVVALNLARAEAVKRGAAVSVSAASTDWSGGWSVQAGTELVQSHLPARPDYAIRASVASVAFNATGTLAGGNAVTIDVCPTADTTKSRRVALSAAGVIRSVAAPASTCT